MVSMPRESGVTSSSSMSFTPLSRMSACTAAPSATTSIGIEFGVRARARNIRSTVLRTSGMRVEPPTSTTSSISAGVSFASASANFTGAMVRVDDRRNQSFEFRARNFADDTCLPSGSGNCTVVFPALGKIVFGANQRLAQFLDAFAAAVEVHAETFANFRRAPAPCSALSMSSPPRCVSPLVESTW